MRFAEKNNGLESNDRQSVSTEEQKRTARKLYDLGQNAELIRYLKKCRCGLIDEMHESQRKVDRMDYLIWTTEKETE